MAPALPLQYRKKWSPFRLDALGLVTLIGADELSRAIGALRHSWLTEYLPMLGMYLVAANRFLEPLPGYRGYNLTEGIIPPEINGAFTRWLEDHLTSGPRKHATTVWLEWSIADPSQEEVSWTRDVSAMSIGFVLNSTLIYMAVLLGDWYGLANALAMCLSIVVRVYLIRTNRLELKRLAQNARNILNENATKNIKTPFQKFLFDTPNSSKVAVSYIRGPAIPCFLLSLADADEGLYRAARLIGWAAFAVHVVAIGQSCLISQLLAVGVLGVSTMSTIYDFGYYREQCTPETCHHHPCPLQKCDHSACSHTHVNVSRLTCDHAQCYKKDKHDRCGHFRCDYRRCDILEFGQVLRVRSSAVENQGRRACYVALDPTPKEEDALQKWALLPLATNTTWHRDYQNLKNGRRKMLEDHGVVFDANTEPKSRSVEGTSEKHGVVVVGEGTGGFTIRSKPPSFTQSPIPDFM